MPETLQVQLDENLDREYTIDVKIADSAPLPINRQGYQSLHDIQRTGFTFTPRELLHATGCKNSPFPKTRNDQCISYALANMRMLDLASPILTITGEFHSDTLANRSEEIGTGMMCILAEKYFGIPWDQLDSIPPPGTRFDYQGTNGNLNCIFESRGTTYSSNQMTQVKGAIDKKETIHRTNASPFDVELVVSTYIGRSGTRPRIVLADPDYSKFKQIIEKTDPRFYRLRHYCRILQYIGLPDSAFKLLQYSRKYLEGKKEISHAIAEEKSDRGFLTSIEIEGDTFLGRWYSTWLPPDSTKYKKMNEEKKVYYSSQTTSNIRVFQGIRRDIFRAGLEPEPFSHALLLKSEFGKYKKFNDAGVSVFPDGSVMIFKYGETQ